MLSIASTGFRAAGGSVYGRPVVGESTGTGGTPDFASSGAWTGTAIAAVRRQPRRVVGRVRMGSLRDGGEAKWRALHARRRAYRRRRADSTHLPDTTQISHLSPSDQ